MSCSGKQDAYYRQAVLGVAPRIGIEAAVGRAGASGCGPEDAFVGMSDFGASAPAGKLFPHFGITAERVAEMAQKLIG